MQHTWTIDADVLPEEEDAIRYAKVFELHRADRHADRFGESDGRALVANVRAVGEIVDCRTCGPATDTCRTLQAKLVPTCRTRRISDRAASTGFRFRRTHRPMRPGHSCRWPHPTASGRSVALPLPEHSPTRPLIQKRCAEQRNPACNACRLLIVALAPFSQNSNGFGCAGFAYERLTQANPPGLFCCRSTGGPLSGMPSRSRISVTLAPTADGPVDFNVTLIVTRLDVIGHGAAPAPRAGYTSARFRNNVRGRWFRWLLRKQWDSSPGTGTLHR